MLRAGAWAIVAERRRRNRTTGCGLGRWPALGRKCHFCFGCGATLRHTWDKRPQPLVFPFGRVRVLDHILTIVR
jgi:hypothetical protein